MIISLTFSALSLAISSGLALGQIWRFRHALEVTCEPQSARNADGTRREFGHWRVRLVNVRSRPTAVDEIWFLLEGGASYTALPGSRTPFPIELSDHKPVDVVYDLDRFSIPGGSAQQPRCAIAVDARKRGHAGWIGKPPRLAKLRKAPRRKVLAKVETFVAPRDVN